MASLVERNKRYYVVYSYEDEKEKRNKSGKASPQERMQSVASQRLSTGKRLEA